MLTEEQAKEFTPEQIQVINDAYQVKETELRGLANKNADGIFNGAAEKLTALTGIAKGDKEQFSAYFERLGNEWLPEASKRQIELAKNEALDWKTKFENHKGDDTLKTELQKAQDELAKVPELLTSKENEWKEKYENEVNANTEFKVNTSIDSSMPKFDDGINKFELDAKKKNAIDRIKADYELSFDENGKLIGTKDYQKTLVSDLLKEDAELKDLILTEQDKGGGAGGGEKTTKTLNLPSDVSKGAAQKLIEAYIIANEGIDYLDEKFAPRFKELCKENNVL